MNTFSIADKININKLNEKISEFVRKEGHEPYIFANKETLDALVDSLIDEHLKCVSSLPYITITTSYNSYLVGKYQGNKIFRDDTLKFGEIELR